MASRQRQKPRPELVAAASNKRQWLLGDEDLARPGAGRAPARDGRLRPPAAGAARAKRAALDDVEKLFTDVRLDNERANYPGCIVASTGGQVTVTGTPGRCVR